MSDKRTIGMLGLSVTCIALCLLLLAVWLYYFYRPANGGPQNLIPGPAKETVKTATGNTSAASNAVENIRDSLQQLYASTTKDLDSQIDSARSNLDTLKRHLDNKLAESTSLRSEITALLKNNINSNDDMELAKQKIAILQQRVNELRRINIDVEVENRRLRSLLNQVNNISTSQEVYAARNITATGEKNNADASPGSQSVVVSDIQLTAVELDDDREKETSQAQQADRFVGSFMVKNTAARATNGEVVVVVVQPDGQVLQKSTWESGTFETREGKRVYSLKFKYDSEPRPCRFYLSAERFQKGNYTMQLYQNGTVIARLVKTLS
jgi:regulator of replication initiation timing